MLISDDDVTFIWSAKFSLREVNSILIDENSWNQEESRLCKESIQILSKAP